MKKLYRSLLALIAGLSLLLAAGISFAQPSGKTEILWLGQSAMRLVKDRPKSGSSRIPLRLDHHTTNGGHAVRARPNRANPQRNSWAHMVNFGFPAGGHMS